MYEPDVVKGREGMLQTVGPIDRQIDHCRTPAEQGTDKKHIFLIEFSSIFVGNKAIKTIYISHRIVMKISFKFVH